MAAVKELQKKGGQALGPLPFAELESALNSKLEEQQRILNGTANGISKLVKVVKNIEVRVEFCARH